MPAPDASAAAHQPAQADQRAQEVQRAKDLVVKAWKDAQPSPDPACFDSDVVWHGPAPIGRLDGRTALFEGAYQPLAAALAQPRRSPYLFLGGIWHDEVWVATTGNLTGPMRSPWLGMQPGAVESVTVRFGEFYRVVDGQIVEVRCLWDIVAVAEQLGYRLFPEVARPGIPPGPADPGVGLCYGASDPATSAATLDLVESMLAGCNRLDGDDLESMGMAAFWSPDMAWFGPAGVGGTHGFEEFQTLAQGPSVASFPNRRGGFHQARIADGMTAAFTGWPSLQGVFDGVPFRGIAPTGHPIGQNIMDFYVRRGDSLYQNWVLIDLIDFADQCGIDILGDAGIGPAS